MALWLVRAGRQGQLEHAFLDDERIYLNWGGIDADLSQFNSRKEVKDLLRARLPDAADGKIVNGAGQIWAFVSKMQTGDWVVLPSKMKPAIHVGEIVGEYQFEPSANRPGQFRKVRWIETDIPRSNFDQDLLYSFGAFMTVCQISRNDAEARVRAMAENGWKPSEKFLLAGVVRAAHDEEADEETAPVDLERLARDQIAKLLAQRFKGHEMARLVEELLKAQGYTTYRSPEGPDKGIDILAAPGPLGFGQPRICVQVKSGDSPVDRPTLDQLIGAMQNVQAAQGLLVSWGGFKTTVERETTTQFFRVRLWDQDDLIDELLRLYGELDEDIRAEIPLKRTWALTLTDSED